MKRRKERREPRGVKHPGDPTARYVKRSATLPSSLLAILLPPSTADTLTLPAIPRGCRACSGLNNVSHIHMPTHRCLYVSALSNKWTLYCCIAGRYCQCYPVSGMFQKLTTTDFIHQLVTSLSTFFLHSAIQLLKTKPYLTFA